VIEQQHSDLEKWLLKQGLLQAFSSRRDCKWLWFGPLLWTLQLPQKAVQLQTSS